MIRVILADDQTLVRAGFRSILQGKADMTVVAEAGDGTEAVHFTAEHRPDVVLMDGRMPELDGLEATRQIVSDQRLGAVKIVVLTTYEQDDYLYGAIRAGASGFLVKDVEPTELIHCVRVVARGDALLAPRSPAALSPTSPRGWQSRHRLRNWRTSPPAVLSAAADRGIDVADLLVRTTARARNVEAFTAVYRRYVWPTSGLDGVQIAPFQLLASGPARAGSGPTTTTAGTWTLPTA